MTVRRGWCEVIVDYRPELSQQHGYFHGAVIGAIADNASGYPAFTTKSSVHCSCSWGCLSSARAKRASWEEADSMPGKCPVPRERKGEALCHIVVDFFQLKRSRTVCTPPYSLGKAIENFRCLEALVGFASLPDFSATTPLLDPSAKYGQDAQIQGIRRTFRIKSTKLELRSIHK